jgi:hypothetical protein
MQSDANPVNALMSGEKVPAESKMGDKTLGRPGRRSNEIRNA